MDKRITMRDIADELGVSVVTVSKALAGMDGVGESLREQITEKADELGYIIKNEKKIPKPQNPNIAIVISERFIYDNAFYFRIYQKMIMELSEKGFIGILEIIRKEDEAAGVIPKVIQMNTANQVVVVGEMKIIFLENLSRTGVNMIFFDFENEEFNVDSIISDNVMGGYTMTRYLVKNGYKNIGFVGNYKATRNILDRLAGHLKYKLAKSLVQRDSWLISDRDEDGRYTEIKLPKDMPEAFLCNCDETAYNLIKTLENAGYKVPEDIAVVGYDDYASKKVDGVKITTYHVDVDEMIRQCIHIIGQKSINPGYRRGIVLVHGKLVEGNTVIKYKTD